MYFAWYHLGYRAKHINPLIKKGNTMHVNRYELDFKTGKLKQFDQDELKQGQLVFLNGYGKCNGSNFLAVFDIVPSSWGNSYKLVNIHEPAAIQHGDKIKSEKNMFGIGLYYYDPPQFATKEQIYNGLYMSEQFTQEQNELRHKQEIELIEETKRVKAQYKGLLVVGEKDKPRIIAAKNIRKELKKTFPKIKFSVTSEVFAGGDSVDIKWTNGPSVDKVEKMTDKYQGGYFNGMEDIYEYNNSPFNDIYGGAKYVQTHRSVTTDKIIEVAKEHGYSVTIDERYNWSGCDDYELQRTFRNEAYQKSYLL